MTRLHFNFHFAAGHVLKANADDADLQGLFPVSPGIERLCYKGLPFTGMLTCEDHPPGRWELDFVDGLEHGYLRAYYQDFLLEEYRYSFGIQWGLARERDEHNGVVTEEVLDFGPEPDRFDPFALGGADGSTPLRIDITDPFVQIQDAADLTAATECCFYRGRPFTGTLVHHTEDGGWAACEYFMGFMHGSCRDHHPNGQLKIELWRVYEQHYGIQRVWDPEGVLIQEFDRGARPTGPVHVYGRIWNSQGETGRHRPAPDHFMYPFHYGPLQR